LGASAWTLVNDFEQFADGEDVTGLYPVVTGGGALPEYWVYAEDVNNPDSNKGYFIDWGSNAAGGSGVWVSIPFEEELPEDSYLSIYFRLYSEGYSNKWHIGTTMKKTAIPDTDPVEYNYLAGWGDHNTIFRFTPGGLFGAHTGGYKDSVPEFRLELFQWHEFVMIQNNSSVKEEKNWRVYRRDPGSTEWIPFEFDPAAPFIIDGTNGWKASVVQSVRLLGSKATVAWEMTSGGLRITPPVDIGTSSSAWAFEILTIDEQYQGNELKIGSIVKQ